MVDAPELRINVDRIKAGQLGLTQRDVANSLLISLSGSGQVAPNHGSTGKWRELPDPGADAAIQGEFRGHADANADFTAERHAGDQYGRVHGGRRQLANDSFTGVSPNQASMAYGNPGALPYQTQLLSNLATVEHDSTDEIVNHYNVQPVFDVYANVDRRDLGGVASQVEKIMQRDGAENPQVQLADVCAARPPRCKPPSSGLAWASSPPSFWYTC